MGSQHCAPRRRRRKYRRGLSAEREQAPGAASQVRANISTGVFCESSRQASGYMDYQIETAVGVYRTDTQIHPSSNPIVEGVVYTLFMVEGHAAIYRTRYTHPVGHPEQAELRALGEWEVLQDDSHGSGAGLWLHWLKLHRQPRHTVRDIIRHGPPKQEGVESAADTPAKGIKKRRQCKRVRRGKKRKVAA